MNRLIRSIFFLPISFLAVVGMFAMLATPLFAQSDSPTIYAESFRKGSTQIIEESFEAKLSPKNPTYREMIKDARGNDRYELIIRLAFWRAATRSRSGACGSGICIIAFTAIF